MATRQLFCCCSVHDDPLGTNTYQPVSKHFHLRRELATLSTKYPCHLSQMPYAGQGPDKRNKFDHEMIEALGILIGELLRLY